MEVNPFLVRFGRPWGHMGSANLAQQVQQQPVVVFGIGVVARRNRVVIVITVPILDDLDDLAEVQLVQAELQIQVIGEEILCHAQFPYLAFAW